MMNIIGASGWKALALCRRTWNVGILMVVLVRRYLTLGSVLIL